MTFPKMRLLASSLLISFLLTAFASIIFISKNVSAANSWVVHNSDTGLFKVRIPNEFETNNTEFRINNQTVVQSGELISAIDQRPYKNTVKNYIVKYQQTIGSPFGEEEMEKLVNQELNSYVTHYRQLGGLVKNREMYNKDGGVGGEIYISYDDPDMGLQGIRANIFYTDTSKMQQIVTGTDKIMFAIETKNFFSSLTPNWGTIKLENSLQKEWERHASPSELFAVYLPKTTKHYAPSPPVVKSKKSSELISFTFHDPARQQRLFYKTYGHSFNGNLQFADARKVIMNRHIAKHRKGAVSDISLKNGYTKDKLPTVEAEYTVAPPKGYPYINLVKLRGVFFGNHLMVQEIMGSQQLVRSNFVQSFMPLVEFTPKRAQKLAEKAKALKAEEAGHEEDGVKNEDNSEIQE